MRIGWTMAALAVTGILALEEPAAAAAAAEEGQAAARQGPMARPAADDGALAVFAQPFDRTVEFTTSEGTRMNPDVSPDGRSIVFDLLGDLYVVGISGGEARALSSGPAVEFRPRYSPDGRRIAFVSDRNGTDNLWVMNADGSAARMISAQSALQRPKDIRFFILPTWLPDGTAVCASTTSELTFYGADDIRCYPVDGAEGVDRSTSITHPDPLDPDTRPIFTAKRRAFPREGVDAEFSHDGRYLYYSVRTGLTRFDDEKLMPQYQLGQFDRATSQLHSLTNWPQGAFSPRLSPDGRWLVYAVRYDADTALRLRDLSSGAEKWLVFPVDRDAIENWWTEGLVNAYSFLPDSASLVTSFGGKLWRVSVPEGTLAPIPFTVNVRAALGPLRRAAHRIQDDAPVHVRHVSDFALSPDGKKLAFRALARVWVKDWPDGTPRRVTRDEDGLDDEAHPAWTPDGASLVFGATSIARREGHIYEWSAGTRKAVRRLTRAPGYYTSVAVTPDGRTIVALRAPLTRDTLFNGIHEADLVRLPRNGGESQRLMPMSIGGGPPDLQFRTGDSSRVFYFDAASSSLVSVSLDGRQRREHLRIGGIGLGAGEHSPVHAWHAQLSPDGRALVLHDEATAFGQIDWIDLSGVDLASPHAPLVTISGQGRNRASSAVRRLSTAMGGICPFWSRDSANVYFAVADQVFGVPAPGGETRRSDARNPGVAAGSIMAPRPVASIGLTVPRRKIAGTVVLKGARLLTMHDGQDIPSGDIVVTGARIAAIGPTGSVRVPDGARVIDASGLTIMPGFVSSHSHNGEMGEMGPLPALAWPAQAKLAYGVTTMLDPASPMELYTVADLVEAGLFDGPRTFMTGPLLSWDEKLDSPEDARDLARRGVLYHDCCMKVYDTGGRLNRQWLWKALDEAGQLPVLETEGSLNVSLSYVLDGAANLAHGLQMPVYDDVRRLFGRSGSSIGYQFNTLVGNGGPSTLFYYFNHELDEHDARTRRWIPYEYFQSVNRRRLTVADVEYVFAMYGENLGRMMDAGTSVHLGEHGVAHGLANHWTIWAMAAGSGNRRALEAATIQGAYGLGMEQDIGSLVTGKLADLLVLEGNPLEDIRNTMKLRYVMRGGELYDAMTLAQVWPQPAPGPYRWWSEDMPQWRAGTKPSGGAAR